MWRRNGSNVNRARCLGAFLAVPRLALLSGSSVTSARRGRDARTGRRRGPGRIRAARSSESARQRSRSSRSRRRPHDRGVDVARAPTGCRTARRPSRTRAPTLRRRDDRQSSRHRLGIRDAESLVARGKAEDPRAPVLVGECRRRSSRPSAVDPVGKIEPGHPASPSAARASGTRRAHALGEDRASSAPRLRPRQVPTNSTVGFACFDCARRRREARGVDTVRDDGLHPRRPAPRLRRDQRPCGRRRCSRAPR